MGWRQGSIARFVSPAARGDSVRPFVYFSHQLRRAVHENGEETGGFLEPQETTSPVTPRAAGTTGICGVGQPAAHGATITAGPHPSRLRGSGSLRPPPRQRRRWSAAWLAPGYAHTLDHDYAKAIDPLNRAKAGASELGDYVAYNLGNAYLETGRSAEVLSTLAEFTKTFPDSLLIRDAHLTYANALLAEARGPEAAALLEKERIPLHSDVELAIGRAYEASGQNDKAAAAFRNIYYNLPTSSEAEAAGAELRKLSVAGGLAERRSRADLLFRAKHYADAAGEYRALEDQVGPAERPGVQLALATALEKSGRSRDARQVLTSMGAQAGDAEAERLYLLSETARSTSDEDAMQRTVSQLRQFGPASPWLEQALFSSANLYLLKRDYDRAIDDFRELQQRFPSGVRASYAHWKVAWLSFRQGRTEEATKGFEDQIALLSGFGRDSGGALLEGASCRGGWQSGDGACVLPEALRALS